MRKLTDTLAGHGIRHERDTHTEGDGRRTWYDAAGVQLGRYDVEEGWRIVEEMRGGATVTSRRPTASWRGILAG